MFDNLCKLVTRLEARRDDIMLVGNARIPLTRTPGARYGYLVPYAIAVEAADVRNKCGETSTPTVASVNFEIRLPILFVPIWRPRVEEIQSRPCLSFDR
jgi:hypothetical protein